MRIYRNAPWGAEPTQTLAADKRRRGAQGLEADCMAPGYEIKVVPTKDGKTAKDAYLPVRKADK